MDPKTDKLVRRTTIGATVVVAYLLLTADYGPNPNVLDPGILKVNQYIEVRPGIAMVDEAGNTQE